MEEAEAGLPVVVEAAFTRYPAFRPAPDDADVERAGRAIAAAKRPVIVAGGGVRLSSAAAEVVAYGLVGPKREEDEPLESEQGSWDQSG